MKRLVVIMVAVVLLAGVAWGQPNFCLYATDKTLSGWEWRPCGIDSVTQLEYMERLEQKIQELERRIYELEQRKEENQMVIKGGDIRKGIQFIGSDYFVCGCTSTIPPICNCR